MLKSAAMAYVIKRYSNRKLYDTQESRYVTLDEIEEMIRAGKEIQVVDAGSGEDLTSVTLSQIILESERHHRAALPAAFLHQLIKYGATWQDFVQRSMKTSLEGIVSNQREMDRIFREWSARAGWGTVGATPPRPEARREPPASAPEPDAERLRDEVASLRERLKSLEERLEKRKTESK
ncbi:MAG: transcriptional regulator [Candidatus Rokubacteria bacterium]|nr:transcriptional regulator [Candidatus Rokubacteria bacterium]